MGIFGLKRNHLATLSSTCAQPVKTLQMTFVPRRQGDQMKFRKNAQNVAQPIFCQNQCRTLAMETSNPKVWATSVIHF
jgi:hypothetical protein